MAFSPKDEALYNLVKGGAVDESSESSEDDHGDVPQPLVIKKDQLDNLDAPYEEITQLKAEYEIRRQKRLEKWQDGMQKMLKKVGVGMWAANYLQRKEKSSQAKKDRKDKMKKDDEILKKFDRKPDRMRISMAFLVLMLVITCFVVPLVVLAKGYERLNYDDWQPITYTSYPSTWNPVTRTFIYLMETYDDGMGIPAEILPVILTCLSGIITTGLIEWGVDFTDRQRHTIIWSHQLFSSLGFVYLLTVISGISDIWLRYCILVLYILAFNRILTLSRAIDIWHMHTKFSKDSSEEKTILEPIRKGYRLIRDMYINVDSMSYRMDKIQLGSSNQRKIQPKKYFEAIVYSTRLLELNVHTMIRSFRVVVASVVSFVLAIIMAMVPCFMYAYRIPEANFEGLYYFIFVIVHLAWVIGYLVFQFFDIGRYRDQNIPRIWILLPFLVNLALVSVYQWMVYGKDHPIAR